MIDGTYEIIEMLEWSKEDIDLVETGFIRIMGNPARLKVFVNFQLPIQSILHFRWTLTHNLQSCQSRIKLEMQSLVERYAKP